MRIVAVLVVAVLSPQLCQRAAVAGHRGNNQRSGAEDQAAIKVETFAKGLVHPWGMAFLPDGRLLVTERPGRMRLVGKDGRLSPPLQGVPPVLASGQGGLLDVALGPDFASSRLIYFSYSEPRGGGNNGTSVARAKLVLEADGGRLDDLKVIFRQEPATSGGHALRLAPRVRPRRQPVRDAGRALPRATARRTSAPTSARWCASARTARCRPTTRS